MTQDEADRLVYGGRVFDFSDDKGNWTLIVPYEHKDAFIAALRAVVEGYDEGDFDFGYEINTGIRPFLVDQE